YSHTSPVTLPASLRDVVTWVFGLATPPATQLQKRDVTSFGQRSTRSVEELAEKAQAAGAKTYSVPELTQIYRYPAEFTGKGQTIGVVELTGGSREDDLKRYFKAFPVDKQPIYVGPNQPSEPLS